MRFSDFCEKFLNAHDLYNRSWPRSVDTLHLALKEAGFTVTQAEHLRSSFALWVGFSTGEKNLGPLLEVHYIAVVPWWLRLAYKAEARYKRLPDPQSKQQTLRSYD